MDTVDPTPPNGTNVTRLHPEGSRPGEIDLAAIRGALASGAHDRSIKDTQGSRRTMIAGKPSLWIAAGALFIVLSASSWLHMLNIQAGLGQIPQDASSSQIDELSEGIAWRSSLWFYASAAFFLSGLATSAISMIAFLLQGTRR